ncbi:MAG: COG1361 S-layer family protein [Nanoarchaeota archaeon]
MNKLKLFFIFLFLAFAISFSAAQEKSDYCVNAELNDLSPTSIEIGENFTVGILIDNCGNKVPESITFELKDVSPYIFVKEELKKEIGELGYANSDRFIVYHMKASDDIIPGEYFIDYKLTYGNKDYKLTKEGKFELTVIGEKAELNLASLKTKPILPHEGENVELTLRIENYGDGKANSIKVIAENNFEGTKEAFIGTLDSNEDGPVIFNFIAPEKGEYEFPIIMKYNDDLGEHEVNTQISINILKKDTNWKIIILAAVLILIVIFIIIGLLRKANKREQIIKQLLKDSGNHKNKK